MRTTDLSVRQVMMHSRDVRSLAFVPAMALLAAITLPLTSGSLSAQRTPSSARTCDTCDLDDSRDLERELEEARSRYEAVAARLLQRRMMLARTQSELAMTRLRSSMQQLQRTPDGWLGVTFSGSWSIEREDGGKEVMRFSDYPTVEAVEPGSPAERAGIEAGDRLIALDGHDVVEGTDSFAELLQPGARLPIRLKRDNSTKDVTVEVGKRPQSDWSEWGVSVIPAPPAPPTPDAWSRVRVMPPLPALAPSPRVSVALSGVPMMVRGVEAGVVAGAEVRRVKELRDYFDVDDGLLVLHVVRGTPAARSGLRAGDVIVRAGDRAVTTPIALQRALSASDAKQTKLDVVRKGKKTTVVLGWER